MKRPKRAAKTRKLKVAVYTVLVGQKELLNDPLFYLDQSAPTDLDLDFICFTDNPELRSSTWTMRHLEHPLLPPARLSRLPKALPHQFLPDYDYSLYMDNTVVFKRLPQRADLAEDGGYVFRAFRHPWRNSPRDEADIVAKSGLDKAEVVADQLRFYSGARSLDDIEQLTSGTMLLRSHHHPAIRRFGQLWWEQILLFSLRDQISLDLCAREAGCKIAHFPGTKSDNDLCIWPILPNGRRLTAAFDADLYAWEHRGDAEAVAQPRLHFLANESDEGKYVRPVSWFDYACERSGSSLGRYTPPRRGLADIIQRYLGPMAVAEHKLLLVGMACDDPRALQAGELDSAEAALRFYFRFAPCPQIVKAVVDLGSMADPAPFRGAQGQAGFNLVIVLGVPTEVHERGLSKFLPLLAADGYLVLEFVAGLNFDQLQLMRDHADPGVQLDVFHGGHIGVSGPIPSSVIAATPGGAS